MISKEKKQAIMAEYCKNTRRYRFTGSTGSCTDSKNSGTYRAPESEP